MRKLAASHPYLFVVGIFIVNAVLAIPFVIAFKLMGWGLEPLRLIIPVVDTIFVLGVLYHLRWLRVAGFGGRVKNIHLLWFPVGLAFVPVFYAGTVEIAAGSIAFYGVALLFTGISEEGLARGIMLRALLPRGIWVAVLFMAALFVVGHGTNLFFEEFTSAEVVIKILTTGSFAVLYGALFLRILNIWPLIIIHAVHDFSYLTSGTAGPFASADMPLAVHGVLAVLSIGFAVFILRGVKADAVLKDMSELR